MTIEERIAKLENYKKASIAWNKARSESERQELRTYLNQNKSTARREVIEAGCFKTLTISPPPAVGGLIM